MTETTNRRDRSQQPQHIVDVPNSINMVSLLGPNDEHLSLIESGFDADVHVRGNRVTLRGESHELALAERLIDELVAILRTGQGLTPEIVERAITMLRAESQERPADVLSLNILSNRGRTIRPKTLNQKRYVDAIDKHTIVFGIGPAGTGKTYLAMAKAVQALQSKNVNRIILTRPAVEAGERLGYLPGTLSEKIDPYLRPLYDALLEITLAVDHLAWAGAHAKKVLGLRKVPAGWLAANHAAYVEYQPMGVVGVIGPWNYPVFTPMGSIAYALAAGNAVVFKPSEHTPAIGAWLAASWQAAVPDSADAFSVVTGFGETGAALCRAPVDKLAFTGSAPTGGRRQARRARAPTPWPAGPGGK